MPLFVRTLLIARGLIKAYFGTEYTRCSIHIPSVNLSNSDLHEFILLIPNVRLWIAMGVAEDNQKTSFGSVEPETFVQKREYSKWHDVLCTTISTIYLSAFYRDRVSEWGLNGLRYWSLDSCFKSVISLQTTERKLLRGRKRRYATGLVALRSRPPATLYIARCFLEHKWTAC